MVTGVARVAFPEQAGGSLILKDGKPVGSSLIGQNFSDPKYFWGRPSATGPMPYNAGRFERLQPGAAEPGPGRCGQGPRRGAEGGRPGNTAPVPVDLVTASASGLDPHISLAAAEYQAARVARVRGIAPSTVNALDRAATPKGACSGCWARRASTCSSSTSRWTRHRSGSRWPDDSLACGQRMPLSRAS